VVAFTAKLTHNMYPIGPHETVIFDNVTTNMGNAYHAHGGLFLPQVGGVYVLSITTSVGGPRHDGGFAIVKNSVELCRTFGVNMGDSSLSASGTCVVSVHLAVGEDVWVQSLWNDDTHYLQGDLWTSFTGFLLAED
jgi:hypothetical protein